MSRENIDALPERVELKRRIREDIERAFNNRIIINFDPIKKDAVELMEASGVGASEFEELSDEEIIYIKAWDFEPNSASVDNSHDYKDLILAALRKLASVGVIPKKGIAATTKKILAHEYGHHVPALGQDDINIMYCVDFYEDPAVGFVGFRPTLRISGKVPVGIYKDIVGSAPRQSATDKVVLEKLNSLECAS